MPNCARCGAPLTEGTEFCPNCGTKQIISGPKPRLSLLKKDGTPFLIIIIILAVVVIAAIGSIVVINALRQSADNQVWISVNSVTDPYVDRIKSPSSGSNFILINITMLSLQDQDLMMMASFFSLNFEYQGTNETVGAIELTNQTIPMTLQAGNPLTFGIGFEVPEGAHLQKIHFHGIFVNGEATLALTEAFIHL